MSILRLRSHPTALPLAPSALDTVADLQAIQRDAVEDRGQIPMLDSDGDAEGDSIVSHVLLRPGTRGLSQREEQDDGIARGTADLDVGRRNAPLRRNGIQ